MVYCSITVCHKCEEFGRTRHLCWSTWSGGSKKQYTSGNSWTSRWTEMNVHTNFLISVTNCSLQWLLAANSHFMEGSSGCQYVIKIINKGCKLMNLYNLLVSVLSADSIQRCQCYCCVLQICRTLSDGCLVLLVCLSKWVAVVLCWAWQR